MRSKYGAKKITADGCNFDSKKEYVRFCELKLLERSGAISALRRQVPYVLIPSQRLKNGRKELQVKYVADFVYRDSSTGDEVVEDVKGYRTDVYKIKRKLMLEKYGIEIKET